MQVWDWSYMVRDVQMGDGYDEIWRIKIWSKQKLS